MVAGTTLRISKGKAAPAALPGWAGEPGKGSWSEAVLPGGGAVVRISSGKGACVPVVRVSGERRSAPPADRSASPCGPWGRAVRSIGSAVWLAAPLPVLACPGNALLQARDRSAVAPLRG
ncbi:MAG: hypothetical protein OHK0022_13860 [Roseiflexaceae bacterium]